MHKLISTVLITLSLLPQLMSQTFSFQHIGVKEGLTQSVITSVSQDDEGIFWIGTMAGLTRYDGSSFQSIIKEDGLAENWITSSLKDKNGNIWFGHWGGGVTYYDKAVNHFSDMKFERFSKFKTITSIIQDNNGDIWFGTNGSGAFKFEASVNAVVTLTKSDGFQSDHINDMVMDASGNIWFATKKGIVIYRAEKTLEEKGAFMVLGKSNGLCAEDITKLELLGNEKVVAASDFDGITIIDHISKLNELSYKTLNKINGFPSDRITSLFANEEENFWVGTRDMGVIRYNWKKGVARTLSTRQGLNYFKVNTIFEDRESNIWIGTDLGLNLFRGDEFLIYDETDGIINNVIWCVAEDKKHRIWMGTNEGISRVSFYKDEAYGILNAIESKNFTTQNGLSNSIVMSICVDQDENVWCGTGRGGITVLDENGKKLKVIDSIGGLASNTVFSIIQDKNRNIWTGTDKGVSLISPNGNIKNFTTKDGLGGDNIYKVFEDSKGNIWFASIGGHLSRYDQGQFIRYEDDKKLSYKFITAITEDQNGNIWFGAYGSGIFKYDGTNFTNYNKAHGLSSNSPYSLITDEMNNLWIGTSKGIDKFNMVEFTTKNYREQEGFMGVEPNPNAVCKDHEGNIWFGTIMGAVKFDLSSEKMNSVEPITFVEGLRVDHEIFEFPVGNEFAHDENHITFNYIGVSLTNPEHVEYKYQLIGFDQTWSPITKDQDVVYSNLPPGKYEFKVMASNNDGLWNELPASYSFEIKPPFWRTWWFYTILVLLVLEAGYIGDKYRMRKLIAAKEILEKKVEERTAEVVEQKKMVEEKNIEILDSIKYAKRIQEAILPATTLVKEYLKESFILYKPKDIVAGDFYWFEVKGDDVYIAAADCTGHGVPGAMVSVVCANALNRAVNEMALTEPAQIMDQVRDIVVATFEKSEHQVKDGMDISFCRINLKTLKLTYTGANNPLYLFTKRAGELDEKSIANDKHMLQEFKGDKQPIGKFAHSRPFTQKEIALKKGDTIFISTDGYADQFGGPKERKFMYKPLKNLFLSILDLSPEEQMHRIDQNFMDWKGRHEQIDDVCVIGVKIG